MNSRLKACEWTMKMIDLLRLTRIARNLIRPEVSCCKRGLDRALAKAPLLLQKDESMVLFSGKLSRMPARIAATACADWCNHSASALVQDAGKGSRMQAFSSSAPVSLLHRFREGDLGAVRHPVSGYDPAVSLLPVIAFHRARFAGGIRGCGPPASCLKGAQK